METDYTKVFYCTAHRRWLSVSRFYRDASRKFGMRTRCKSCN